MDVNYDEKLNYLIEKLHEIVMVDNIISEDEEALLEVIRSLIDNFKVSDSNLSEIAEERKTAFHKLITALEDDSLTVAEMDDLISEDEIAMLGYLFKELSDLKNT